MHSLLGCTWHDDTGFVGRPKAMNLVSFVSFPAGSDLVAASAAALAAASVAFKSTDAAYSAQLLTTAQSLYT